MKHIQPLITLSSKFDFISDQNNIQAAEGAGGGGPQQGVATVFGEQAAAAVLADRQTADGKTAASSHWSSDHPPTLRWYPDSAGPDGSVGPVALGFWFFLRCPPGGREKRSGQTCGRFPL